VRFGRFLFARRGWRDDDDGAGGAPDESRGGAPCKEVVERGVPVRADDDVVGLHLLRLHNDAGDGCAGGLQDFDRNARIALEAAFALGEFLGTGALADGDDFLDVGHNRAVLADEDGRLYDVE